MKFAIVVLAGALSSLPVSSALSAVTFTSRLSTANATRSGWAPQDSYNDTATFNSLGASTLTLPHGFSHQSTVTNSGVSGRWNGSYDRDGNNFTDTASSYLDSYFTVGAGGIKANITLSGSAYNYYSGGSGIQQNAYFVITDTATNTVVFDSTAFATFTLDIPADYWLMSWNNLQKEVNLSAGSYRLQVGADGDFTRHPGPGGGFYGGGGLTASMTFSNIPAPASIATLAGFAALAARRRR